jgi:hypothetical protein
VRVRGVSGEWGGGGEVGTVGCVIVRSDSPRPPRWQHRGGTPILMPSETPGRLRLRHGGDAASGGEGRMLHRGSSEGVSCARGDGQQVSCSARAGGL